MERTSIAVGSLWAAYILLLPFQRVLNLPWLGTKLQLPELVFIGLAAASLALWWRRAIRWRFAMADGAVAAWVVAHGVALLLSDAPRPAEGVTETLTALYLAALYGCVRLTATPHLLDRFAQWFGWSAAIAAALGIAGTAASLIAGTTQSTELALPAAIPYFGYFPRAQAWTAGPQMLASILLMAVPVFVGSRMARGWRRRDVACVALLGLGLVATMSKTVLCVAVALSVMWAAAPGLTTSRRVRALTAAFVSVSVAALFAVGSRIVLMRQGDVEQMTRSQLVAGQPLVSFEWHDEPWAVMPTTYAFNTQASLLAIGRTWPAGLGPAGQPRFAARLQQEGRFPRSIWMTTPHSTYLGAVAELGAAGLAALALLLGAALVAIRRLLAGPMRYRWEAAAFAGAGSAFLIEALSTDLLSCRHYWFLLAVIVARVNSVCSYEQKSPRGTRNVD